MVNLTENTLLTIDLVGEKVLARLINSLACVHTANRDYEDAWSGNKFYPIGSTLRIRKPVYLTVNNGAALNVQGLQENYTNLTIQYQKHVDLAFTSIQEQRELSNALENIYLPAAQALANEIDSDGLTSMLSKANRIVGTPGAGMGSFAIPNLAVTTQRKYAVQNSKYMMFNNDAAGSLRAALQNSFNTPFNEDISQEMIIGRIGQHDMYEDQNLPIHTTGTLPGTPVVNGANQSGDVLLVDGFTASQTGVLKANDIITVDGMYGVNPQSRLQVGYGSGNFVQLKVLQDVDSDSAGNATTNGVAGILVQINDYGIITSGPYKNVSAAPADGAAIACFGVATPGTATTYGNNLVYSRDAVTFACVPGPVSQGAVYSKVFYDEDTGIGIRANIMYDITTDRDIIRFDVFYGWQSFAPYMTLMAS